MSKKIKNVLLWISILPASLLGSFVVYWIYRFLFVWSVSAYMNPGSWISIIFMEFMSNMITGLVFVSIAFVLAPNNKKIVSIIFTALLIFFCGMSLYMANFVTKEYFSNIGIISTIVGSVGACLGVIENENKKQNENNVN